jgi:hypothetical protein
MIISDNYKATLEELQNNNRFKGSLVKYDPVKEFIDKYKPQTIVDYGCAKGVLVNQLRTDYPSIVVDGYDPGVPEFNTIKQDSYECLISNDVIEHFEPEFLDSTLQKMETLFTKSAWLIIACYPAKKRLPDGRNAHLIIESPKWWIKKIKNTFTNSNIVKKEIVEFSEGKPELRLILEKL